MNPRRVLQSLIHSVRSRLRVQEALRGVAISLLAIALSFVAGAVIVSHVGHGRIGLLAIRLTPIVTGLVAFWLTLVRRARRPLSDQHLARLIEQTHRLSDRVITAVEFSGDPVPGGASPAIVERLIRDAGRRAASVDPDRTVDIRKSWAWGAGAVGVVLSVAALFYSGPAVLSIGMLEMLGPIGRAGSSSAFGIGVQPGDALVPRGSNVSIRAGLKGFEVESAQIFTQKSASPGWAGEAMEPARRDGEFQYQIFRIQDSVSYYVEAAGVRSAEYTLRVADLPYPKQLDLLLTFPAYTGIKPKQIENGGEVAGLEGTVVRVTALMTDAVSNASIVLGDGRRIEMAPGPGLVTSGEFAITAQTTYHIEVTSPDGQHYNGTAEFDVNLLEDKPPSVVIESPGRDERVTSVQEVFTEARADDDYGIRSLELVYSVNGGAEARVPLLDSRQGSLRTATGSHTFFLEDLKVRPGDFISYYARARDNSGSGGQESTSDIYFMEVRPFEHHFRQGQQQGGGASGDEDQNALARKQQEIIAATFRVQREERHYEPAERDENYDSVKLSQQRLSSDTHALVARIKDRLGPQLGTETDYAKLADYLSKAGSEMDAATQQLDARKARDAMPPEQRALENLYHAQELFRDIQVTRGSQSGGAGQQDSEDLADLFELQLDKMKNQYETIQRQQQAARSEKEDEIARRLEDLARRQQQQVEQRMRSGDQGGAGRNQRAVADEARKLARELERLSRDRRDPQMEEAARQLAQSASDLEASSSQSSGSQNQSAATDSTAAALRALSEMQQAKRLLDAGQRSAGQQGLQALRQRAEDALKTQEEIERGIRQLTGSKSANPDMPPGDERRDALADRNEELANAVSGLKQDISQAARETATGKPGAADKLSQAAGAISQGRLAERISQNSQLIESGQDAQALNRGEDIKAGLKSLIKDLQAAETSSGGQPQGPDLEGALAKTQDLVDKLESLKQRLESTRNGAGGSTGQLGQQAGQGAPGQQSDGKSSRSNTERPDGDSGLGTQGSSRASGQQQGGSQKAGGAPQQGGPEQRGTTAGAAFGGNEAGSPGGRPDARQITGEISQRIGDLGDLARMIGSDRDLRQDLSRSLDRLRQMQRDPAAASDPGSVAALQNEVIGALRQLEIDLARKLGAWNGDNISGAFSESEVPDKYKKMIDEYYKRLSVRSGDARP